MSELDVTIQRLAARRGLLTHDELLAAGASPQQISRRLASGALAAIHRGIYIVPALPDGYGTRLRAALVAAKGRAVVSHSSAAVLWGFPIEPAERPEITVIGQTRPRTELAVVHRVTQLARVDRTTRGGLAVTTAALTLLDCGSVLDEEDLARCLEYGLYRDLLTIRRVRRVLERVGGHGRRGTAALRALLDARDPLLAPTESELEFMMDRLFTRYEVPRPTRQFWVDTPDGDHFRLDYPYVDIKLAVEVDGRVCHSGVRDFVRDRQRTRALVRLGWGLLPYTWPEVKRHPRGVANEIISEVTRRRSLAS